MKKTSLSLAIASAALLSFGSAQASDNSIGINVGQASLPAGFEDSTTVSVTASSKFNDFVGVETQFTNIGKSHYKPDSDLTVKGSTFGFALAGYYPATSNLTLSAKVGYHFWNLEADYLGSTSSDDGSDVYYGLGLSYMVSDKVSIDGGLTRLVIDDEDVDNFSIGASYHF